MQLNQARILIVEDEPFLREIIAAWFKREAKEVLSASNGAVALEILAAKPVDVIISDIRMPIMDGVTMLRKIKEGGVVRPGIVFITGFSDFEPRDAYDLGVEAILEKPVARAELIEAVKRSLAGREELWRGKPGPVVHTVLKASLEGLSSALSNGQLALGRGGFCIESAQNLREGAVDLELLFRNEGRKLSGRGLVRWSAPDEQQLGVELVYVDDESRPWLCDLIERSELLCFIPRSTRMIKTVLEPRSATQNAGGGPTLQAASRPPTDVSKP